MHVTTLTWIGAAGGGGPKIRKSKSHLHLKISVTESVNLQTRGIIMFGFNITALVITPIPTEIRKDSDGFYWIPNPSK